jgi:hypothetical protein
MGPRKPRRRPAANPDFAALRRLTQSTAPDLDLMRAVLERVGKSGARMRYAEGVIYVAACQRYSELTGTPYGPAQGTY